MCTEKKNETIQCIYLALCDFRHQTTYFKCYQLIKSQLLTVISSINSNCKCLFLLTRTAQGAYYLTLIIEASSTLSHW